MDYIKDRKLTSIASDIAPKIEKMAKNNILINTDGITRLVADPKLNSSKNFAATA